MEGGSEEDPTVRIPDEVLVRILSSLKDARLIAQASTVCKRWKGLARRVSTLHFYSEFLQRRIDFEEIVTSMVLKCTELRSLQVVLHSTDKRLPASKPRKFSEWAVNSWLGHLTGSLECLFLSDLEDVKTWHGRFEKLSDCRSLKTLVLSKSEFISPLPLEARPLKRLTSLTLYDLELGGGVVESLIALCPQLQKLLIQGCRCPPHLVISCPSLVNFGVKDPDYTERIQFSNGTPEPPIRSIKLDTPALTRLSLEQVGQIDLADGRQLTKLHIRGDRSMRLGLSSTGALNDLKVVGRNWEWGVIQGLLDNNNGLRTLAFYVKCGDHMLGLAPAHSSRLERFLRNLQGLKRLEIGAELICVLSGGALDADPPDTPWLPEVEELKFGAVKAKQVYIDVLRALLRRCPKLKKVAVETSQLKRSSWNIPTFFSDILALQRLYPHVVITLPLPDPFLPPPQTTSHDH